MTEGPTTPKKTGQQEGELGTVDYIIIGVTCAAVTAAVTGLVVVVLLNRRE